MTDLIEVKSTDANISTSLKYYTKLLNPKRATQIVGQLKSSFHQDGILVTTPVEFFKEAPWAV